jgi:hypothetical protein
MQYKAPAVTKVELLQDSDVIDGMQTYLVVYETGEEMWYLAESCEEALRFADRFYFTQRIVNA